MIFRNFGITIREEMKQKIIDSLKEYAGENQNQIVSAIFYDKDNFNGFPINYRFHLIISAKYLDNCTPYTQFEKLIPILRKHLGDEYLRLDRILTIRSDDEVIKQIIG